MGTRIFWAALAAELLFAVWTFVSMRRHAGEKAWVRGAGFLLGNIFLCGAALFPAILFPRVELPQATGPYEMETAVYTWVDESRVETFTDTGEKRALTVKFWYPQKKGRYPLTVFSHGAFGVIDSNASTCAELASNGYVAASIGHTYHAAFVKDAHGKVTLGSPDFIREIYADNGTKDPEARERVYRRGRKWMALRTADENFVLDTILKKAENREEGPFERVDREKIGLFGHSMGGASSVSLGRERDDIDAVIDLEGTMLGEYMGFENGAEVFIEEPYKVPLLDVNSGAVYEQAKKLADSARPGENLGETYVNFYVGERAADFREVVFRGAGHLNFTDLPLVSPLLAKLLGTGDTDPRECIENVNSVVLAFFDCYLKGEGGPDIEGEYP